MLHIILIVLTIDLLKFHIIQLISSFLVGNLGQDIEHFKKHGSFHYIEGRDATLC